MDRFYLLGRLPLFQNRSELIQKTQSVHDIVREVLDAHEVFAKDYDGIAADFWKGSTLRTCETLFSFLKSNVKYRIEPEKMQTTKSPAALLTYGDTIGGDCKHYAGFIGGVLDGIRRTLGKKIKWSYRFASYNYADRLPSHVFVVVNDDGRELWIDPVLKYFNQKIQPAFLLDRKIKTDTMALARVYGLNEQDSVLQPGPTGYALPDSMITEPFYGENPVIQDFAPMQFNQEQAAADQMLVPATIPHQMDTSERIIAPTKKPNLLLLAAIGVGAYLLFSNNK